MSNRIQADYDTNYHSEDKGSALLPGYSLGQRLKFSAGSYSVVIHAWEGHPAVASSSAGKVQTLPDSRKIKRGRR